jgi:dihydrofolate reductase
MHKIIESTLMSLDGVIDDPVAWAGGYLDKEFERGALQRLMETDAMLMGRQTYEMLARIGPPRPAILPIGSIRFASMSSRRP